MLIAEIIERSPEPVFSFEFFPPKTEEGEAQLRGALEELAPLEPSFVSVTYGALGTTRDRTLEITKWIKHELGIEAMHHLTCVGATREEIRGACVSELEAAASRTCWRCAVTRPRARRSGSRLRAACSTRPS